MSSASLETPRLRLDPWNESHTELLVRLSSIPEVMRFIGPGALWPRAKAQEVAAAKRKHWSEHGFGWRAATERATDELIGFIALNFAGAGTAGLDPAEYEIGWWLAPEAWGRGLAREGALAVRDEAFNALAAPSVVARIQPANAPSTAVAEAIGLKYDFSTTDESGDPVVVYRLAAVDRSAASTVPSRELRRSGVPAARRKHDQVERRPLSCSSPIWGLHSVAGGFELVAATS